MSFGGQQYYLFADPVFFESPGRWDDDREAFAVSTRSTPSGWTRSERDPWIVLRPNGCLLPDQGWKIHVASTVADAEKLTATVWDYCQQNRVAFKFLRNRNVLRALSAKYAPRPSSGKLMTLYPEDVEQLRQILNELDKLVGGVASPYILSDLRWREGPLYVRYGGFVERFRVAGNGRLEPAIADPDGTLVSDRRRPTFTTPAWVTLPAFLEEQLAARRVASAGRLPYQVVKALHFSNGGGVYLGRHRDGHELVLKEARPLAGVDAFGQHAVTRLRRERWALDRLRGIAGVPALHDYFTAGDHEFLAEEYIAGPTLYQWQGSRYPYVVWEEPEQHQLEAYTREALAMYDRISTLVAHMHARGVVFDDLHPANIMVTDSQEPYLVDFEVAHEAADVGGPALRAAGFAAPDEVRGFDRDRHALAALGLWLFLPLNRMLQLVPDRAGEYLDFVIERFALPTELQESIDHWLIARRQTAEPESPVVRRRAPESLGSPVWRDSEGPGSASAVQSMVRAILSTADPERTDRLFPGDVAQFVGSGGVGFAHGAGGVLWALATSGQGRYPDHERWFAEAVWQVPDRGGFFDGLHGLAYLADFFDLPEQAETLLARATSVDAAVTAVGLYSGLAGSGMNLLRFAERTGDTAHRDAGLRIAARLAARLSQAAAARADPARSVQRPDGVGLLHGWTGAALLFIRAHQTTGEPNYLDLAVQALTLDLDGCVTTRNGSLQVGEVGVRTLCYLDGGSAGLAIGIDELLDHREDDRLRTALPGLLRACASEVVVQPTLFHGRSGLIAALTRAGARLSTDYRHVLARHIHRLALHSVSYHGELAYPGNHSLRLSTDVATGSAGVLLALHAVTAEESSFLPFLSRRRGWCGRGEGPVPPKPSRFSSPTENLV